MSPTFKKTSLRSILLEPSSYQRAENTLCIALEQDLKTAFRYVVGTVRPSEGKRVALTYAKEFYKALYTRMNHTSIQLNGKEENLYLFYEGDTFRNALHAAIASMKTGFIETSGPEYLKIFTEHLQEDLIWASAVKARTDIESKFYGAIIKQRAIFNDIVDSQEKQ